MAVDENKTSVEDILSSSTINDNSIIKAGVTTYDVQEQWLKMATKYFDIDLQAIYNGTSDINSSKVSLLKAGLFGYINEIMANEVKNATAHRNVLYDEHFLNTASFPESIYNFAKTYNVPITLATPAHMSVSMAVRKSDLVNSSLKTEVKDNAYIGKDLLRTYQITVSREYIFSIDKFNYLLPYDVIITMRETKNGDHTITAKYDIVNATKNYGDIIAPDIKIYQDTNNGEKYVYLNLDIYQVSLATSQMDILNADMSQGLYHSVTYSDQLVGFNVYYQYSGKKYLLNTYFNNTFTPTDSNEKFCYYSFLDDDTLQISFSPVSGAFRPAYNSSIIVETFTSLGSAANFNYEGQIAVNFNNNVNEFNDMLISVFPITSSTNGTDRFTLVEEKNKIINKILSRDNLILDSDLNSYFEKVNRELSLNGSKLKFMKKRDDVLKRVYNSFLLMREPDGKVVHSNTANKVQIPLSYFTSTANGNAIDGYVIPEHSVFKYDQVNDKYILVENGFTQEIRDEIASDRDNLLYVNPFLIKIDVDPFLDGTYYSLDITDEYSMNYTYSNSLVPSSLLVNNISIDKTGDFATELESDTYTVKLNLNSNEPINDIDSKIKIRGLLLNEKTNEKYGYFEFSRELIDSEMSDSSNSSYVAHLSTNRKFKNGLLSISDSLYSPSGEAIDNVFIDEDTIVKVGILYSDTERNYRTSESSNAEYSFFSDHFPSDAQGSLQISDYVLAMSVTTNDTVRLYQNLGKVMSSTITRDELSAPEYGNQDFIIDMIPLVGLEYFIAKHSYFFSLINRYIEVIESILPYLENNTTLDLKFYNTRGPSKQFYFDYSVVGDEVVYNTTDRVDILLDFGIHLFGSASDQLDLSIKDFISDFLEACNETHVIPISNLIRLLEQNYDEIKYIEFNGLSGRYSDVVSNKYQKINMKDINFNKMSKQEIIDYVPEFINVKKRVVDSVVTVSGTNGESTEINLGKTYNDVINITYSID